LYALILKSLLQDPFYKTQDAKNSEFLVSYFYARFYCQMQQLATHKFQNGFKVTKICDPDSGKIILRTLSIPYIILPFSGAFANNLPKGQLSFRHVCPLFAWNCMVSTGWIY